MKEDPIDGATGPTSGGDPTSVWGLLSRTLEQNGYALTPQRRVIFSELCRTSDHPTAEELHARLRRDSPELSLATVYKSLHLFMRVGLARAVPTPDGRSRFEASGDNHHHLRCIYCGAIADIEDDRITLSVPPGVGERSGFMVLDAEVQLSGICDGCRDRVESATGLPLGRAGRLPRRTR